MRLTRLANWFNQNRGIVTVCRTYVGDIGDGKIKIDEVQQEMERELLEQKIAAFPEVHIVPDFEAGIMGIIQANGFAGMHSNTVMFGWTSGAERIDRLLRIVRIISQIKRNTILAHIPGLENPGIHHRIDVWWRGMQKNGDMMLVLAHLLNLTPEWRQAKVHLRTIVSTNEEYGAMCDKLKALITDSRMLVEIGVIVNVENEDVVDLMHRSSKEADIVFLGLALPNKEEDAEFAESLDKLVTGFNSTILVRNAESTQGELIE